LAFGIDKDVVRRILATHFHPEAGSGGPEASSLVSACNRWSGGLRAILPELEAASRAIRIAVNAALLPGSSGALHGAGPRVAGRPRSGLLFFKSPSWVPLTEP
jgi:hypothetical protein